MHRIVVQRQIFLSSLDLWEPPICFFLFLSSFSSNRRRPAAFASATFPFDAAGCCSRCNSYIFCPFYAGLAYFAYFNPPAERYLAVPRKVRIEPPKDLLVYVNDDPSRLEFMRAIWVTKPLWRWRADRAALTIFISYGFHHRKIVRNSGSLSIIVSSSRYYHTKSEIVRPHRVAERPLKVSVNSVSF